MKSAHEICGCLDGVNCALTADRDELLRQANSAENRARLAEDRERVLRNDRDELIAEFSRFKQQEREYRARMINERNVAREQLRAVIDAQEPRT